MASTPKPSIKSSTAGTPVAAIPLPRLPLVSSKATPQPQRNNVRSSAAQTNAEGASNVPDGRRESQSYSFSSYSASTSTNSSIKKWRQRKNEIEIQGRSHPRKRQWQWRAREQQIQGRSNEENGRYQRHLSRRSEHGFPIQSQGVGIDKQNQTYAKRITQSLPPQRSSVGQSLKHDFKNIFADSNVAVGPTTTETTETLGTQQSLLSSTARPSVTSSIWSEFSSVSSAKGEDYSSVNFERGAEKKELISDIPAGVSQTDLIQAIGRPFHQNNAVVLPHIIAPGNEYMLTRRASEVRLDQIPFLSGGKVSAKTLERFEKILKFLSHLIGGLGISLFILMICTETIYTPMEYFYYFFETNPICKPIFILGTLQPFVVAPSLRYALLNLKHIRTYYLRVPPSLVLPLGILISTVILLSGCIGEAGPMTLFLHKHMQNYFRGGPFSRKSIELWDGIQSTLSCCGFESYEDWKRINNGTRLPASCCQSGHSISECTSSSTDLNDDGCETSYKTLNVFLAGFYISLAAAIIITEVISAVILRKLWDYIRNEVFDERSTIIILGGKCCSLCDIENSEDEDEDESSDDEKEEASEDQSSISTRLESILTRSSASAYDNVSTMPETTETETWDDRARSFRLNKSNRVEPR